MLLLDKRTHDATRGLIFQRLRPVVVQLEDDARTVEILADAHTGARGEQDAARFGRKKGLDILVLGFGRKRAKVPKDGHIGHVRVEQATQDDQR